MSDPAWAPVNETASDIWAEEANIDGVAIATTAYGVHLTLFFLCFNLLWDSRKRQPTYAYSFLTYISALVVFGSIGIGATVKFNQETYVNNRNFPGGPEAYNVEEYGVPYSIVGTGAYIVNSWLQDGLLIYRFYIMWGGHWLSMTIPLLVYLVSIIMSCFLLAQLVHPGGTIWQASSVNFALGYWSTSIATSVLLTLLIIARLLYARYRLRNMLSSAHLAPFLSVSAMLVESAALYTAFALPFIITYAKGNSANFLFLAPLGQIQSIAPLLIILRVAQGRAATRATMQETITKIGEGMRFADGTQVSVPSATAIELYSIGTPGGEASTATVKASSALSVGGH